jgi:cytochrome P450
MTRFNLPPKVKIDSIQQCLYDLQRGIPFFMGVLPQGPMIDISALLGKMYNDNPVYVISGPQYLEHILHDQVENYHRLGPHWYPVKQVTGNGIFTSDGLAWKQERALLQPFFEKSKIEKYQSTIIHETQALIMRWDTVLEKGNPLIKIVPDMYNLTLRIMMFTVFGREEVDFILKFKKSVDYAYAHQFQLTRSLTPPEDLQKLLNDVDESILSLIQQFQNSPPNTDSFLSFCLTLPGFSVKQIKDNILAILLAGYITSQASLSWILFLLAKHSHVQLGIYKEIENIDDVTLLNANPPPLLQMVIDEALRLYPPPWLASRTSIKHDKIDGYDVLPNTTILYSPYAIHRHPDFWEKPDEFNPWRFDKQHPQIKHSYSYLPFNLGPHMCVGRQFAFMEIRIILSLLLKNFTFELANDNPIIPICSLSMSPPADLTLKVVKRVI